MMNYRVRQVKMLVATVLLRALDLLDRYFPEKPKKPAVKHITRPKKLADITITIREDAEKIIECLSDVIDTYEYASLADFYELVGISPIAADHKWGWSSMNGATVIQIREGYFVSLPEPERIP